MARDDFGRGGDRGAEQVPDMLDDWTAERLLQGAIAPDDAPPGYVGVATLLEAARNEARTVSSSPTDGTVAAMVEVIRTQRNAARPTRRRPRSRVAASVSSGLLVLFGSLAAAGALPSSTQNRVSTVLSKVGIDVPRGDGNGDHPEIDSSGPKPGAESNPSLAPASASVAATDQGDCCAKPPTASDAPPEQPENLGGPPKPTEANPEPVPEPTRPPHANSGAPGENGNGSGSENGQGDIHREIPPQASQ